MRLVMALVAVGLTAACNDSPEPTALDSGPTPALAEASIEAAATTAAAIAAFVEARDAAWNDGDGRAYANQFTVQAEQVNPLGQVLAGREAIRARHEFLFTGPFAGTTSTTEIRRTVFLDDDARMVDLDAALTGFGGLPPGLQETEPGVLRTRIKWILVQRTGGWKILAEQVTAVAPTPP